MLCRRIHTTFLCHRITRCIAKQSFAKGEPCAGAIRFAVLVRRLKMFAFYRSRDVSAAGASSDSGRPPPCWRYSVAALWRRKLMYACVWNYVLVEVRRLRITCAKKVKFPSLVQSLFILSIPPTWRRVVSITSLMSLRLMYILQRVDQSDPKMSAFPFTA